MRIFLAGAAALMLAACTFSANTGGSQTATGCAATASTQWAPEGGPAFTVEANVSGPDCQHAVATLVIRDAENTVQWAEIYHAEHIMVLAGAADAAAMQTAANEWVAFDNHTMNTTGALPEWPANAEQPQNGEFPFYPETDVTRDIYNTYRTRNLPMYCYVQGMESQACLTWDTDRLVLLGVQSFPG